MGDKGKSRWGDVTLLALIFGWRFVVAASIVAFYYAIVHNLI